MNERIEKLMSIICEGQNSIQREEVENYINNLQSKIDKAIEYIDKHFQDNEGIVCKITGEYEAERNEKFIKELLDILKEEQSKEAKELFEGTMNQLNNLSIFKEDK